MDTGSSGQESTDDDSEEPDDEYSPSHMSLTNLRTQPCRARLVHLLARLSYARISDVIQLHTADS